MRFTIRKRINIFTMTIAFIGLLLGGYSMGANYMGMNIASDLSNEYLPANDFVKRVSDSLEGTLRDMLTFESSKAQKDADKVLTYFKEGEKLMNELVTSMKKPGNDKRFTFLIQTLPEFLKTTQGTVDSGRIVISSILAISSDYQKIKALDAKFQTGSTDLTKFYYDAFDDYYKAGSYGRLPYVLEMIRLSEGMLSADFEMIGHYDMAIKANDMSQLFEASEHMKQMQDSLEGMKKLATRPEVIATLANMTKILDEMFIANSDVLKYYEVYSKAKADYDSASIALSKHLLKMSENTYQLIKDQAGISYKMLKNASNISFICLIIMFIVSGFIMWILNKNVSRQINVFVGLVKEFTSGDGNLTKRLKATHDDELADLAFYFNKFVENVQDIIVEVKSSTDEVVSGSNQLATTMEELSTTFASQTQQVSDIVSRMDSISGVSRSTVDALSKNLSVMDTSATQTKAGAQSLDEISATMEAIRNQTVSLSSTITRLSESSAQIGEILTVINGIAGQTNLLALNAAIEAARAGDAGKGFAVVADEVRKLAERTQKATGEIETIITSLQTESSLASQEMTKAAEAVHLGVEKINGAAGGFKQVVSSVTAVHKDTVSVSSSVSEQYRTIEQVTGNTQSIASGIEESNSAVVEVTDTVSHLQQRAGNLKQMVGKFIVR